MTASTIVWGATVPLVGGMVLGPKSVIGHDPKFMLSYTGFAGNEATVKHNFPKVPHYSLDVKDHGFDPKAHQDVDFLTALCPCAGLSQLSSGSQEQRDGMNSWMLNTCKYVLKEIKPKVYWGENAPGLYSGTGERVREHFRKMANDNGYSMSIYRTNTMFHGIPQSRKRTFYFFWRDSDVPVLEYYRRPEVTLSDYLKTVPKGIKHNMPEDLEAAEKHLLSDPRVMFIQDKYAGQGLNVMREWVKTTNRKGFTIFSYLILTDQLEEAQQWMEKHGHEKHAREARRIINKIATKGQIINGKVNTGGFWDSSFPVYKGDGPFATLISRTLCAIHPDEDRTLTTRECMALMGMPNDYELVGDNKNIICQNVPVCTAADMTREVVAYLNGERKISTNRYMLQDNINQRVDLEHSSLLGY